MVAEGVGMEAGKDSMKKLSDTKSHSRKVNLRKYTILQVTRASQWTDRASEE